MSIKKHLIFIEHQRGWLYKLIRVEKNFEAESRTYGVQVASLVRLGDEKTKTLKLDSKFEENYSEITEEEKIEVFDFISKTPNPQKFPVKIDKGIIKFGEAEKKLFTETESKMIEEMFQEVENPQFSPEQKIVSLKVGTLIKPEDRETFEFLVASDDIKKSIISGISKIELKNFLKDSWGLDNDSLKKSILNFYGPPGTGKTLAAKAVANSLNKRLLQVDYSQVESKWVGDTGKNIQKVFEAAKKHDAIILFDEADSLVSSRVKSGSDHMQQYLNQNRNIFMQELDKFEGIVVLTTNLFENYDEALLRRVSQHLKFELPDALMREDLMKKHIPAQLPLDTVDIKEISHLMEGFSGGDIKNVINEAAVSAALDFKGKLSEAKIGKEYFIKEINKIKNSKTQHQGLKKVVGIS